MYTVLYYNGWLSRPLPSVQNLLMIVWIVYMFWLLINYTVLLCIKKSWKMFGTGIKLWFNFKKTIFGICLLIGFLLLMRGTFYWSENKWNEYLSLQTTYFWIYFQFGYMVSVMCLNVAMRCRFEVIMPFRKVACQFR